ncbi:MAG: macro domain-containing protein [Tissierellia bacterium]|jgi:O-acetyl-ADP-ribose deacetylase (regulator of RNase III)|nr:macro domain-containing protein [Tissierellia bacterium]
MPLQIIRNDITKMDVDVIVNAANSALKMGGGVCGAIFKAAGAKELQAECDSIGGCETGNAVITKGYKLPARHIIHTVGPVWHGGKNDEEKLLRSCYIKSLNLAKEYELESIAFPLISSGIYGYPKGEAFKVAVTAIQDFLLENEMMVYLIVFDKAAVEISEKLYTSIEKYIDDKYVDEKTESREFRLLNEEADIYYSVSAPKMSKASKDKSLEDIVSQLDETFSEMLLRLIDEKEMTDVETYKKANIDRKLFSKIRIDKFYRPRKATALALCIALELNLDQTKDLLGRAGYALSRSSKFDIIVEYFIERGIYNIFEINEALFAFEENLLGV